MLKKYLPWIAGFAALVADILTKSWIVKTIPISGGYDFWDGFIRITLVYNDGGVFGILRGHKSVFLVVSLVVLAIMIGYYIYEKNRTFLFTTAMALIFSGALGNILDRMISDRPGVVDFISIGIDNIYRWPSFNIADSVIVIGAFLLIIVFYKNEKSRETDSGN